MKTLCPAADALAARFEVETTRRLLPGRSPILPAVDVTLTVLEVSVEVKLAPPIVSRADKVIELGALILPPRASPPLVDVSERSVALIVAAAPEVMLPAESKLNVAPALEAAEMLVLAPVFWMNTF